MSTLERAIAIAAEAHAGAVDKAGAPYIFHPLRVMLHVQTLEEKIVAVLHDVVEDTPWTIERLRGEGFSESVLAGIEAVSRRDGESYDQFVLRSGEHPIGRIVKIADLIDNSNTSRVANPTDRDHVRWKKYQRALAMLGVEADNTESPQL
jgi:(p)ppGpp synthase/HD superfamily hydrolase